MVQYSNILIQEYQYDTKSQLFAELQQGGELYPVAEDGFVDGEGRQLTRAEIEWLEEVGKWIIRLIWGIPIP